jgi:hypothetical protein
MGYRSDVRFVVALPSEAERDSIMALYSMHPLVQEHDMATDWTPYEVMAQVYHRDAGVPMYLLSYDDTGVKWYDSYEDVQAVMHMEELLDSLEGRCYAYRFIRIGEDDSDIECKTHCSEDDMGEQMYEYLSEVMYTEINLVFDIKQIEA